jgi:uncharacterized phage-associated protein
MAGRYPSKAVANWDLQTFWDNGKTLDQLQINKLVYIAHGWHLAADPDGDGLIAETVHAWKYGPVIPALRDEFREFGSQPITRLANDWVGFGYDDAYEPKLSEYSPLSWEVDLLKYVYTRYGSLSGPELIDITHRPGTPWYDATGGGKRTVGVAISNDSIRQHYTELLAKLRGEVATAK